MAGAFYLYQLGPLLSCFLHWHLRQYHWSQSYDWTVSIIMEILYCIEQCCLPKGKQGPETDLLTSLSSPLLHRGEVRSPCCNAPQFSYLSIKWEKGEAGNWLIIKFILPLHYCRPSPYTRVGEGLCTPSALPFLPFLPFLPGPIKQQLTDKVGLPKSILRSTQFHSQRLLKKIPSLNIWSARTKIP